MTKRHNKNSLIELVYPFTKKSRENLSAQTKQRQVKNILSLGMHRKVKSQLSQWKKTSATASSFSD